MQMPLVHLPKRVAIPHQAALPMVVEIVPAHGDPVARPHNVALPIVRIRSRAREPAAFELVVVYPYPGAVLDGDTVVARDASDAEVADDHVGLRLDVEPIREDVRAGAGPDERLVRADREASGEVEGAAEVDRARCIPCNGGRQRRRRGDRDGRAGRTTCRRAKRIVLCEAYKRVIGFFEGFGCAQNTHCGSDEGEKGQLHRGCNLADRTRARSMAMPNRVFAIYLASGRERMPRIRGWHRVWNVRRIHPARWANAPEFEGVKPLMASRATPAPDGDP